MENLPSNVLRQILLHLPVNQRFNVRGVCRAWDANVPINDFRKFQVEWLQLGTAKATKCFNRNRKIEQAMRFLLPRCAMSLKELDFGSLRMELNDEFVEMLVENCPNLQILSASNCQIWKASLWKLKKMEELKIGNFDCSKLHESTRVFLDNLRRLELLELDHDWVKPVITGLKCDNLIRFKLSSMRSTCPGPGCMDQATFDELTTKGSNMLELYLCRSGITSLKNLAVLEILSELAIEHCPTLTNSSHFVEATVGLKCTLTSLTLAYCPNVTNFYFILELPHLINVNLEGSKILSLDVFSSCLSLKYLNLANCKALSNCGGLIRVDRSNLESLNLSGSAALSYAFLENLTGLRDLNLEDSAGIKSEDLDYLSDKSPLRSLSLRRAQVDDKLLKTIVTKNFKLQKLFLGAGQVSEQLMTQLLDQNPDIQCLEIACLTGYDSAFVLNNIVDKIHLRKIDLNASSKLETEQIVDFLKIRIRKISENASIPTLAVGLMQYYEDSSTLDLFNLLKVVPDSLKKEARIIFV